MWYEKLLDHNLIPDPLLRSGIRERLANKLRTEMRGGVKIREDRLHAFVQQLKAGPIAIHTDAANQQHYEVPAEFFRKVLGARMKYSSGFWPAGVNSLDAAEEAMLALYTQRAGIEDGQEILDLGCGWGSLALYLAEKYPQCRVVGLSNAAGQKQYIESEISRRHVSNLTILTANVSEIDLRQKFDRVLSIEMFEHMRNYGTLFRKITGWMKADALLFIHIFSHKNLSYPYATEDKKNWLAQYFFTGGIMPSQDLLLFFQQDVRLQNRWRVNGKHYQKTCEAWLQNMDGRKAEIMGIFRNVYREKALRWWVYWRIFFMSCAELFGYRDGEEWFVSHYLFEKR